MILRDSTISHLIERDACPTCKNKSAVILFSCSFQKSPIKDYLQSFYSSQGTPNLDILAGGTLTILECDDCGLIYQNQIPDDFLSKKIYEEWIDPTIAFNNRFNNVDITRKLRNVNEILMLISILDMRSNELKFLDFGMGWADWCMQAKTFGCDVYGSELSPARLEHALRQGIRVVGYEEIKDHQFDYINTEQVLEHLPDPRATLSYLRQSLKRNGLIKISVPNGRLLKRNLRNGNWGTAREARYSMNAISPLEHINCFDHQALIKLTEDVGYERVKIPIRLQYKFSSNWMPIKSLIKNLVRPLYMNIFNQGTYLFFKKRM